VVLVNNCSPVKHTSTKINCRAHLRSVAAGYLTPVGWRTEFIAPNRTAPRKGQGNRTRRRPSRRAPPEPGRCPEYEHQQQAAPIKNATTADERVCHRRRGCFQRPGPNRLLRCRFSLNETIVSAIEADQACGFGSSAGPADKNGKPYDEIQDAESVETHDPLHPGCSSVRHCPGAALWSRLAAERKSTQALLLWVK